MAITGLPALPTARGIESLRGRTDPEAVRTAAREMESLFAYEMVKAMHSAAGGSAMGEGFGGEVYETLFDLELAKVLASRGLGLQELLLRGLGQTEYSGERKPAPADPEAGVPSAQGSSSPTGAPPTVAPPAAAKPAVESTPAVPAVSGLHTHDPMEESPQDDLRSGEEPFPVSKGGRISSSYGYRKDPFTGETKFHHGMDISVPEGTPIRPVRGGEVVYSGYRRGYGNVVEIDHGNGLVTRYAHNRANRVAVGDRVGTDTVIAEVGSTGRSTGPHVHFEVRYEGKSISPETAFAGIAKGRG